MSTETSKTWTKCLSTMLGVLLGLLFSLGAIIPLLILSKTSASTFQTTTVTTITTVAPLSGSPVVPGLSTSSYVGSPCGLYFCEQKVFFASNMTITELQVTITVQRTGNATYTYAYSSNSPPITSNHTDSSSEIVYTFFLQGGQLSAGNYSVSVQFNLSNSNHTSSIDRYSVSIKNICGNVATASGHF